MDAVKFLKEADRMHNFDGHDCVECEIYKHSSGNLSCVNWVLSHPDEAVKVVEQWAKEHPKKTRQSEFLKIFPEARLFDGVLVIDPCKINNSIFDSKECRIYSDEFGVLGCEKCREQFWNEVIE